MERIEMHCGIFAILNATLIFWDTEQFCGRTIAYNVLSIIIAKLIKLPGPWPMYYSRVNFNLEKEKKKQQIFFGWLIVQDCEWYDRNMIWALQSTIIGRSMKLMGPTANSERWARTWIIPILNNGTTK